MNHMMPLCFIIELGKNIHKNTVRVQKSSLCKPKWLGLFQIKANMIAAWTDDNLLPTTPYNLLSLLISLQVQVQDIDISKFNPADIPHSPWQCLQPADLSRVWTPMFDLAKHLSIYCWWRCHFDDVSVVHNLRNQYLKENTNIIVHYHNII